MSMFDRLAQKPNNLPDRNVMQGYVQQLKQNPAGFLAQMGYNIPQNLDVSNPNNLVNYLLQSNQVNSGLLAKAQSLLALFR